MRGYGVEKQAEGLPFLKKPVSSPFPGAKAAGGAGDAGCGTISGSGGRSNNHGWLGREGRGRHMQPHPWVCSGFVDYRRLRGELKCHDTRRTCIILRAHPNNVQRSAGLGTDCDAGWVVGAVEPVRPSDPRRFLACSGESLRVDFKDPGKLPGRETSRVLQGSSRTVSREPGKDDGHVSNAGQEAPSS